MPLYLNADACILVGRVEFIIKGDGMVRVVFLEVDGFGRWGRRVRQPLQVARSRFLIGGQLDEAAAVADGSVVLHGFKVCIDETVACWRSGSALSVRGRGLVLRFRRARGLH